MMLMMMKMTMRLMMLIMKMMMLMKNLVVLGFAADRVVVVLPKLIEQLVVIV